MRIVQVCPYAWVARGGVQTHIRSLTSYLAARGHQLLVLAPGGAPGNRPRHRVEAARVSPDVDVRLIGSSVRVPFNGSTARICIQPFGARTVRDELARFEPDVVHVHEPLSPSLSMFATWHARAPIVATFHAHVPTSLDAALYSLTARCVRRISRRISVRLAVSNAAAACAGSRVDGPIHIVPNGVDLARFAGASPLPFIPGRKLLVVSRLDRRKGFDVALRAMSILAEQFGDLSLVVVGDGPCRDTIDRLPPGLRQRVLMLGDVSDDVVRSVYAAVDVFVAPATGRESFGLVLLEAMAAGVPIVASDIEGYREVVRGDTDALLVPPEDDRALAGAVARLLSDSALAHRLRTAGRERVRHFAWDAIGGDIERIYRTLADANSEATASVLRQPLAGYALPDATS